MSLEKFQLFFDATQGNGDEVTAFLRTSAGGLLTSTTAGGKEALDVNIAASDISISVAESDVYAEDSAHVSGDDGAFMLAVRRDARAVGSDADGDYSSLNVNASGELWVKDADVLAQLVSGVTVTATDLDIRDLNSATDSIAAVQSGTWSVEIADGGNSITVDATDLDIRDLSAAQDSVASWTHDGAGNAIDSQNGALKVADCVAFGSVSAPDLSTANTAATITAAANQEMVEIQNLSTIDIYYGPAGTTTVANGLIIPKKSVKEVKVCGNFDLIAASAISAGDIRVGQFISG